MIDLTAVILGTLNVLQVLALALITAKQAQVKRELHAHNGEQATAIAELRSELERSFAAR